LKYFEIPACGTLLLAPGSQELTDLGFVDGVTFVTVNETNVKAKAEYYLQNDLERERIIQNGMHLIEQRHTTAVRAQEMLQAITNYLSK
jgi:spore maturation protein CgeB